MKQQRLSHNTANVLLVYILLIKNWNQSLHNGAELDEYSLYITYKELKPIYLKSLFKCSNIVYILLIKNWNNTGLNAVLKGVGAFIYYL